MANENEQMNDDILDLDAVAPQSTFVKLKGKRVEVLPPEFNNLVNLMKTFQVLQVSKGFEAQADAMLKLQEGLCKIVPALAEPNMDLSIEQMMVLFDYIQKMSAPKENKLADEQIDITEKKTEEVTQAS